MESDYYSSVHFLEARASFLFLSSLSFSSLFYLSINSLISPITNMSESEGVTSFTPNECLIVNYGFNRSDVSITKTSIELQLTDPSHSNVVLKLPEDVLSIQCCSIFD